MSRKKLPNLGTFLGFSSRLRKIRGTLSQEEFGKHFGVTKVTISRYEAGRIPDEEALKRIAEFGGVTVEWLLRGEEKPGPQILSQMPGEYDAQPLRPMETGLIIEVVAAVEQLLAGRRRLKLTPAQKGRLTGLVYEHCRDNREQPTVHLVEKYLLLAD
jgi:transcriptional regulator with XRE-family HTH domain